MYLLCITCKNKKYMNFQTKTYGLSPLTSFIYGLQNDPLIDITLFWDSILLRKYILKIKFKDFVTCQL
jgi:hypothetical protein